MPRKGKRPIGSTIASKCAVAAPQPEIVEPTQEESNESPIPPTDSSAEQTRKEQVEERPTSPEIETDIRPRKTLHRTLTQDEEDDLVAWLRENSFLFDKSSAGFKYKEKKNSTWAAKEAELGLKPGDLSSIWYTNMRTQYSKLIKLTNKSGSGAGERTARQQWILDNFEFLRPYLVQLRTQRGSKFAEKRKELVLEETEDDDAASDSSAPSTSAVSGCRPKAARVLSSLTSELESVRGAITVAQDPAAHTGQFLVYLMRQMDQQRMNVFVTRATRLALDLAEESQEEKRRLATQEAAGHVGQQIADPVFAMPVPPAPTSSIYRRQAPISAAFGSAWQQNQFQQQDHMQQDFQLATNIAASAPPAHLTPLLKSFTHLQPPNVQPILQQPTCAYRSITPAIETPTTTASIIRQAMDMVSTPNSSPILTQEMHDAPKD
ncbi:uncharacterized protein LOC128246737 [Mya arenaria]|nr:uncharacterized protein LOC128204103 [Mya arenaria]XP_052788097.1 uncharacterized protein LOC128222946 [Mya arenaria]XP_052821092.1 uncharacterized protein LOC128246737 [Mya arenaria]